jgi:hypothetical protein
MLITGYILSKQQQNVLNNFNKLHEGEFRQIVPATDGTTYIMEKDVVMGAIDDPYWEKYHNLLRSQVSSSTETTIDLIPPQFPIP